MWFMALLFAARKERLIKQRLTEKRPVILKRNRLFSCQDHLREEIREKRMEGSLEG
jgi:hypothetical protein